MSGTRTWLAELNDATVAELGHRPRWLRLRVGITGRWLFEW